ncbi:MAG: O-antigen ligase family protein [Acidimicrobiales bacterium]
MAVWTLPFLSTTVDWSAALGHRLLWLAELLVVITLVRRLDLAELQTVVVRPLTLGLAVVTLLCASALVLDPASTSNGFNRFEPWGANPNVTGSTLVAAFALLTYWGIYRRSWIHFVLAAFAGAMIVLTGSRGSVLAAAIVAVPFLLRVARRPAIATVGLAAVVAGSMMFIGADTLGVERTINTPLSNRGILIGDYVGEFFSRPWWGLLGTQGHLADQSTLIGAIPHNAYLQFAYWGGISLLVPMLILVSTQLAAAGRSWRRSRKASRPMLVEAFAAIVVATVIHAGTGLMAFYPTYALAFLGLIATVATFQYAYPPRRRPMSSAAAVTEFAVASPSDAHASRVGMATMMARLAR